MVGGANAQQGRDSQVELDAVSAVSAVSFARRSASVFRSPTALAVGRIFPRRRPRSLLKQPQHDLTLDRPVGFLPMHGPRDIACGLIA